VIKTADQIEFAEIFERLKAATLNQSDVARELHISRAAVAMILNGDRNPRPATLAMMRDLEKKMAQANQRADESESELTSVEELHQRLDWLAEKDKPSLDVARRVIESLTPAVKKISSGKKKGQKIVRSVIDEIASKKDSPSSAR